MGILREVALVLLQICTYTYLSIVHLSTMYVCCFLNTCLIMMIASPALIYFEYQHDMIFFVPPSLSLSLSHTHTHTHTPISSPFFGSDRCSMVSLPTSAKVRKNVFFVITTALYYFLCFLSSLQKRWVTVAGAPSLHHKLKSLLVEVVGVTVASLDPTSRRSTAPWRELYTLREWTHPYWYDDNIIYYNMCITGILKISKVTLKI